MNIIIIVIIIMSISIVSIVSAREWWRRSTASTCVESLLLLTCVATLVSGALSQLCTRTA